MSPQVPLEDRAPVVEALDVEDGAVGQWVGLVTGERPDARSGPGS